MPGPWQVLGAARVPMQETVGIDYLYAANWSLWADFKLLVRTVPHMPVAVGCDPSLGSFPIREHFGGAGLRTAAVRRLAKRGDVARLLAVLELRDEHVDSQGTVYDLAAGKRELAVSGLAKRADDDAAIAGLSDALLDPDVGVRRRAVDALAANPKPAAAGGLAKAVATWPTNDPAGRRRAEIALTRVDAPNRSLELVEALLIAPRDPVDVSGLLRDLTSDAEEQERCVARLIRGLRDEAPGIRERSGTLIGWLGASAVDPLVDALARGDQRAVIARALGRTRDRRGSPALMEVLEDPDPQLRRSATLALAEIADPRFIEALLHAADDDDYGVRTAAIAAVNDLGSVAVIVGMARSTRSQIGELEGQIEQLTGLVEQTLSQRQIGSGNDALEGRLEELAHLVEQRSSELQRASERLAGRPVEPPATEDFRQRLRRIVGAG